MIPLQHDRPRFPFLTIQRPASNHEWDVCEMHHPDGHVFRISKGLSE